MKRWQRLFLVDELLSYAALAVVIMGFRSSWGSVQWFVIVAAVGLPGLVVGEKAWSAYKVEHPGVTVPPWFRETGLWTIEYPLMYLRWIVYRRVAGWAWNRLFNRD